MDKETLIQVNKKNAKRKYRSITVLGDSTIKNIESHKMKECIKPRDKIYVKSFSGATIADMCDYSKPAQKHEPDMILLHSGTNDLKFTKSPEEISNEIIKLALDMKTDANEVIVSGIITRDDEFNEKGRQLNEFLKTECTKYALVFLDNGNITNKYFYGSGLHLNYHGTVALANIFLRIINV